MAWMGRVKSAVNMAHALESLQCDSPVVDLVIPMPLDDDPEPWVGKWNSLGIDGDPWKDTPDGS